MDDRRAMLIKRCEDNKADYVLLTYFRSGTTLLKHLIKVCGGEVVHFHQLPKDIKEKYLENKRLILLLRNYKECITSNLHSRQVMSGWKIGKMTNADIDEAFSDTPVVEYRAKTYMDHLEWFDSWENEKFLVHYDYLIAGMSFHLLDDWMGLDIKGFDFKKEFRKSWKDYPHIRLSNLDVHHHERLIENPGYFDYKMRGLNPVLFDKYLKRYETAIHTA